MSVFDNVAFGLRMRKESEAYVRDRVMDMLRLVKLSHAANRSPKQLSGGEQQRIAFARAIAIKPEILLMDEPASALDPIATAKIEELIIDLKRQFTIVSVTHNMQQAARISDHTAFFYLGELIESGPTAKLFTNPSKKQTEDYVTGRFG